MPAASSGAGSEVSGRCEVSSADSRSRRSARLKSLYGPVLLAEPVDQLGQHLVVRLGVLADVHVGGVQPADREGALHRREHPVRGQLAAVGQQRPPDDRQVGEQLAAAGVVPAGLVRPAVGDPGAGVDQLGLDAGQLEPDRLLAVEFLDPWVQQRQVVQVDLDRRRAARRTPRRSRWSWTAPSAGRRSCRWRS